MNYGEDEDIDKNITPNSRREKIKDGFLDDTFNRAKAQPDIRPNVRKINPKKPFLKSGILIIVIALLCLAIVNFLPWIHVEYDSQEFGTVKETFTFSYETDFKNEKLENVNLAKLNSTAIGNIYGLFESQCSSCSDSSSNFIGLSINDFSDTAKMTTYSFFVLILLALFLIVFQIFDKIRNCSTDTVAIIHSIFAAGVMITSTYILLLIMKFFGAYILIYSNSSFIALKDLIVVFIVPVFLIILVPLLIVGANAIIKMNFNELKIKFKADIPADSFSNYKFGGRPR